MQRFQTVQKLVEDSYNSSPISFAHWMWNNHVKIVVRFAEELGSKHKANLDLLMAGALLHDFGDAFVQRKSRDFDDNSKTKSIEILHNAGYSDNEITEVLEKVIAPHSCKKGILPITLEGKILATADAMAHLSTDFYVQFTWMHLPENKTYTEFIEWLKEKITRDYDKKIFFDEIRIELKPRFDALMKVFINNKVKNIKLTSI